MNLTSNQKQYLDSFDTGARFACSKLRDKLYYIPESWKKDGNTGALFNIIMHTINDIEISIDHRGG